MGLSDLNRLNCTTPNIVDADPDIAGLGALVAFCLTACMSIASIAIAYLSRTLDAKLLTRFDENVISLVAGWWLRYRQDLVQLFPGLSPADAPTLPQVSNESTAGRSLSAQRLAGLRTEAFTQFLLALSDQQLVTGLAILISAISQQRSISGYEFSVVVSLAWFSSTTHLATLNALKYHLRQRKFLRDFRAIVMVIIFILLIYSRGINTITADATIPVQCLFQDQEKTTLSNLSDNSYAHRSYLNRVNESTTVSNGKSISHDDWSFISISLTIAIISNDYTLRFLDLYSEKGSKYLFFLLGYTCRRLLVCILGTASERNEPTIRDLYEDVKASGRISLMAQTDVNSRYRFFYFKKALYLYNESFLSCVPAIAFSFSYGAMQVVTSRWIDTPSLTSKSSKMTFGQIVPLFLLVLPFLTAVEAIYEYKTKIGHETLDYRTSLENDTSALVADNEIAHDNYHECIARLQSSCENAPSLIRKAAEYDQLSNQISRFFHRDMRLIKDASKVSRADDDVLEILKWKSDVLDFFLELDTIERRLSIRPAILLVCISIMLEVGLGVLFNMSSLNSKIPVAGFVFVAILFLLRDLALLGSLYDGSNYRGQVIDRSYLKELREKNTERVR